MLDVALLEAARGAEAGVGERDVDAPEGVERGLDERLLLVPLGDVAGDGERAVVAAELLGERVELVGGAGGEDERGSRPRAAWRAVAAPMPVEAPVMRKTGS